MISLPRCWCRWSAPSASVVGAPQIDHEKDKAGESACYDTCAEHWPPALAAADAQPIGDLTLVKRKDGSMQWADDGKPLYTYVDDKKPGDVTGDGKNEVWHAVTEE